MTTAFILGSSFCILLLSLWTAYLSRKIRCLYDNDDRITSVLINLVLKEGAETLLKYLREQDGQETTKN